MKLLICVILILLVASSLVAAWNEQQQQQKRILRRVIKSTPTATNLARVRLVTVRATDSTEKGAVSEITSKEAASFGQRSSNETSTQQTATAAATKTKPVPSETTQVSPPKASLASKTATPTSTASSTTTTTTTTTSTTPKTSTSTSTTPTPTPASPPSSTPGASPKSKASERQQAAPEVELMSSAQSSWQMMSAVEAPVAALISAGTRPATKSDVSGELATASNEFSRTYTSSRQQASKTRQQQASFYPPPPPPPPQPQSQQLRQGKTSTYQATKTQWYLPTTSTTSTTTPRPAPIVQEPQYEQYVEQQVDSAPPGQAEPFAFDFNTQDTSGNGQYRKEESDSNGIVRGSYGFRDASGLYRHVDYIADHNGFRASIRSNEPGLEGGRDSQPASIKLDSGPAPARFTSSNNADWTASSSSSGLERADLALIEPDFESSHKAERIRFN